MLGRYMNWYERTMMIAYGIFLLSVMHISIGYEYAIFSIVLWMYFSTASFEFEKGCTWNDT